MSSQIDKPNINNRNPLTSTYKSCFVPGCRNTSVTTPNKIFITVPRTEERYKWCLQVRRTGRPSLSSVLRCCQDHFNMEEDVENWMKVKTLRAMGTSCNIRLKPGVLPHKLNCQQAEVNGDRSPAKRKKSSLQKILQGQSSIVPEKTAAESRTAEAYIPEHENLMSGEVQKIEVVPDLLYLAQPETSTEPVSSETDPRTSPPQAKFSSPCALCGCCCQTGRSKRDVGTQVSDPSCSD